MQFIGSSSAGRSKIIANSSTNAGEGGRILFFENSRGGTARIELSGNGNLDISNHYSAQSVTVGSLEGDGNVFLEANNLSVGVGVRKAVFSGIIQDGGISSGRGGSLTKVGNDRQVLKNANTYTGGTIIESGKLVINNATGSGTGSGAVHVNGGTLRGTGKIAGTVTVGTGSGSGAALYPGENPGAFTIKSALTFYPDSTYEVEMNSSTAIANRVICNSVAISTGAQFGSF